MSVSAAADEAHRGQVLQKGMSDKPVDAKLVYIVTAN